MENKYGVREVTGLYVFNTDGELVLKLDSLVNSGIEVNDGKVDVSEHNYSIEK